MADVDYKWVYRLFFHPGEVVEIRASGAEGKHPAWRNEYARKNSLIYGYFDNEENFEQAAKALDEKNPISIWFSANPPKKACLARSPNILEVFHKDHSKTTSENDIRYIRWFLIDLDPMGEDRVSGTSSNKEELALGHKAGQAVTSWLKKEFGFPEHIGGMSGNGYHIWYRLADLSPSDELYKSGGILNTALKSIALKFPEEKYKVNIDTKVHKAAQLGKLYGTVARKGKHTEDRPHRRSFLFDNCPKTLDEVPILDLRKLKSLVKYFDDHNIKKETLPTTSTKPYQGTTQRMASDMLGPVDIRKYLDHFGWELFDEKKKDRGTSYVLEKCPFDDNHNRESEIFVYDDGTITFHCFHDSCKGYKWKDAKQVISPGVEKMTEFRVGYDPNWTPGPKKRRRKERPAQILSEYASDLSQLNILNDLEIYNSILVKPPHEIDPDSFFTVNANGRKEMVQDYAANYLAAYLNPIAWTDGMYYKYHDGFWDRYEEEKIESILITAFGSKIKGNYIDPIKKVFRGKVRRSEKDWPHRSDLINVKNGMVDLSTDKLELIDHDPLFGSRIQLNVHYDMDAVCDRWIRFIQEIFPEPDNIGKGKQKLLKDFMAYCLMTTCKFEKCLFCYGLGSNGKSTVIDTLSQIVGLNNTCRVSLDQLSERFQVPALQHKLVNLCTESPKKQVNTDVLKAAISGEVIAGEHKHSSRVEFANTAKFIFGMNEPPGITDRTPGFARRVLVLEFNQDFERNPNKDVDLKDYFKDNELDGIFMWMLHSIPELIRNRGFILTEQAEKDHARFMKNINNVLQFVEECCAISPTDPDCWVDRSLLHIEFTNWCKTAQYKTWGKHRFYEQINMLPGVEEVRKRFDDGSRPYAFQGIKLNKKVFDEVP